MLFPLAAQPDASTAVAVDYDDRDLRETAPTGVVYVLPAAPVKDRRVLDRAAARPRRPPRTHAVRWRSSPTAT